jgi:hypothetical protein
MSVTTGNASEAAVLNALVGRGLNVLVPFGGGQPYDLVLDVGGGGFVRVQCKTAWSREGCILFNGRTTDHGRGRLSYLGSADLFGVHFPNDGSVYLLPVSEVPVYVVRLRITPTRNNQRRGVRIAADYAIERWTVEMLTEIAFSPAQLNARHTAPVT